MLTKLEEHKCSSKNHIYSESERNYFTQPFHKQVNIRVTLILYTVFAPPMKIVRNQFKAK